MEGSLERLGHRIDVPDDRDAEVGVEFVADDLDPAAEARHAVVVDDAAVGAGDSLVAEFQEMIGENQADAAKVVLERAALPGLGGAVAALYVIGARPTRLGVDHDQVDGDDPDGLRIGLEADLGEVMLRILRREKVVGRFGQGDLGVAHHLEAAACRQG